MYWHLVMHKMSFQTTTFNTCVTDCVLPFSVISRLPQINNDLNDKEYTFILSFCHNKDLSLLLSTEHYITGLADFPQLVPSTIDSVSQQLCATGKITDENRVWQRRQICFLSYCMNQDFSMNVSWLLCFLGINCVHFSVMFPCYGHAYNRL